MRARPWMRYLVLVAAGVAAGFFLGSRVWAGVSEPGSAADPLVSRSYVDQQVASYVATLEKRVADLTAREAQLEQALAQLQKAQGITPIQPQAATPSQTSQPVQSTQTSSQTSQPVQSSETPQASQPVQTPVTQKLYIMEDNTIVNVRQGPGTGYPVAAKAVRGNANSEPMTVLSQEGEWYQVSLPSGRTGWVASWLVEFR
jgi:hypothetical protein